MGQLGIRCVGMSMRTPGGGVAQAVGYISLAFRREVEAKI